MGEIVGRPMFLQYENRTSGALMTVISGFSQTITIIACGIPAAIFFFFYSSLIMHHEYKYYTYFCLFWFVFFLFIYIQLPEITKWLSNKKITKNIRKELQLVSELSLMRLLIILGYSFVRYVVFCLQFYFLLFFCQVYITPLEALLAITLNYLFVTITPSISFSEVAIRASYAVFFIGFFSSNTIGIASAGVLLWFINFIAPMLIGSIFFAKTKV
jgi:MFS family permease